MLRFFFTNSACQYSTLLLHLVKSSHHGAVGSVSAWQTRCRGFEFPASSMTHSFFCHNYLDFFLQLISFISEPRPHTQYIVLYNVQGFCRLHFSLRLASNFVIILIFRAKKCEKSCLNFSNLQLIILRTENRYRNYSLSEGTAKYRLVFYHQSFCHHTIERFCSEPSATCRSACFSLFKFFPR